MKGHLLLFILFTSSYRSIECNYFVAATGMRELNELEAELARSFLNYYHQETEKLNELEFFLNEYDMQSNSNDEYIYNPLDAYKFLKRFTRGWEKFSRFQRPEFKPAVMNKYTTLVNGVRSFNDLTELWGSIYAIIKLQETYKLEVAEFTEGYKHSQVLYLSDIFTIGYYAMSNGFYAISALWLEEAYTRYYEGDDKDLGPSYNITLVLEALVWDYRQMKKYDYATYYSEKLVELDPYSDDAKQKYEWYRYQAYHTKEKPLHEDEERFGPLDTRPWLRRNNRLCRREEEMRQEDVDKLFCSYYSPNFEFLIKPFQVETLYHDPHLLYFHNLLSQSEVDYIVARGRTIVQGAGADVYSMKTGKIIQAGYRLGKSGWIGKNHDYVVHKVASRLGRITGLDMRYSEPLQVMNYGIGGNYESHYDHATPPYNASMFGYFDWGNRIATILIYLSDVLKGGETVFTTTGPGVIIPPKRGSAVIWYNLKRNGSGDDKTKHAGCPILLGEKWIANLWVHEWGQEFIRPCTLNRND